MRYIIRTLMLSLLISATAWGAEAPPSDESLHRLLTVTQARKLLDSAMSNIDASIKAGIEQGLQGQPISASQRQLLDEMRGKMAALLKENLAWESLEPLYIEVYKRSLTQSEVDGMLAFYATPAGQAVIAKMPLIVQNTMAAMQTRMQTITPQIVQIQQETIAKVKAEKSP